MSRRARDRDLERGMSDEAFKRVVEAGAKPVIKVPTMARDHAERYAEMGRKALDEVEMTGLLAACQAGIGQMPAAVALACAATGTVVNRVLLVVQPEAARLAKALGCEVGEVPFEVYPEWCQRVLGALGPPRPPSPEGTDEEPVEVRAARSGLVIAS